MPGWNQLIIIFTLLITLSRQEPTIAPVSGTDAVSPIRSFLYYQGGSSTYENYSYAVETDRSGSLTVQYSLVCDRETYTLPADEAFLEELFVLIGTYELNAWNGFHGSNPNVLDGSSFGLSISYADGSEIFASGSNQFPKGFGDASKAIDTLFLGYLEENGIIPSYLS